MINKEKWHPSKFEYKKGKLSASRNVSELSVSSRLMVDIIAKLYDEYIPKYAKGKLVDLGCGKVPLYATYKDYITENICVDWGNSFHGIKYLDYECDLSQKLPFNDNEFDTVILSDVLEHIAEPEKLMTEISRIMNYAGKLILNVPFYYSLHEMPYDYYRYTEFALSRFIKLSNLRMVFLIPIGGAPEILTDILVKHIKSFPLIGKPISIILQKITFLFVRTSFGKRISEMTGKHFPFGYFLVAEKPDYNRSNV